MKMLIFIALCCVNSFAQALIQTSIIEKSYQFSADDVLEMMNEVRGKGPKSKGGLDTWAMLYTDITTKFDFRTTEQGCQFNVVTVSVIAEMKLPDWADIQRQDEKIQQWWITYISYLKEHELMHYSTAKKHAKSLLKKMNLPHKDLSCPQLREKYLGYKFEMLSGMRREDQNIDAASMIQLHKDKELMGPLTEFSGYKIQLNRKAGKNPIGF